MSHHVGNDKPATETAHGTDAHPPVHAELPEEILAPDERPTPVWLPLVGVGLAVLALGFFVSGHAESKTKAELESTQAPVGAHDLAAPTPANSAPAAPVAPAPAPPAPAVPEGNCN